MKSLAVAMIALLSGCAVCERHPVGCSVGAAILVGGSIAAYSDHRIDKALNNAAQQSQP